MYPGRTGPGPHGAQLHRKCAGGFGRVHDPENKPAKHTRHGRSATLTAKRPARTTRAKSTPKKTAAPKSVAKSAPAKKAPAKKTAAKPAKANKQLLDLVLKSLDDDKGENIIAIDLKNKSPMADYMVIASGRSARHVSAMAEHLSDQLKKAGFGGRTEGLPQGDWVLVDAMDVIVHLFRPEVRAFYDLEKMWNADAPAAEAG